MGQPVLLRGAGRHVGQAILGYIGDAYDWQLLDHEPPSGEKIPDSVDSTEMYAADITDETTVRNAMDGVHAVIHLTGDPHPGAPWSSVLRNNIDGIQQVFDATTSVGTGKFASASSNHTVGAYEATDRVPDMYRPHHGFRLGGTELPRPSNLYGVSKATDETLDRYYHDHRDISVVNARISDLTRYHPPKKYKRGQTMQLSCRDCGHLFGYCIETDYDYEIVYGISDNGRKCYSIDRVRVVLDYDPQDSPAEFIFEGGPLDET